MRKSALRDANAFDSSPFGWDRNQKKSHEFEMRPNLRQCQTEEQEEEEETT